MDRSSFHSQSRAECIDSLTPLFKHPNVIIMKSESESEVNHGVGWHPPITALSPRGAGHSGLRGTFGVKRFLRRKSGEIVLSH